MGDLRQRPVAAYAHVEDLPYQLLGSDRCTRDIFKGEAEGGLDGVEWGGVR